MSDVTAILAAEKIGMVLVADAQGLAGIISERDIIRALSVHNAQAVDLLAESFMTSTVVTCSAEASLAEILALMSQHGIRHMPVMSGQRIIGMVSVRDVLDFQQQMLISDIDRRRQEGMALKEAYTNLEMAFEARTEEYRAARDAAEAANQAKTDFLANMSHELRTPLNAVIGFSDVMRTEALGPLDNPRYHEYVNDINDSGRLLLSLINDLLDMSKIEAGKEELMEDAVDIRTAARSAIKLVREHAAEKNIVIDIDIRDNLPLMWSDPRKVKQILTNLLNNATKFTPDDGAITIKAWCRADSGFVIQVADTGIGIAPEDIPKALSKFGQIDSQVSWDYDGTGLGLPLAKSYTELHGGSLDLQSVPDAGTTVTLRFPASRIVGDNGGENVAWATNQSS